MNCPTCDAQMWNTEPGFKRCPNDHVFRIEEITEAPVKVIRVDRPSAFERLRDYGFGCASGCALTLVVLQAAGVL